MSNLISRQAAIDALRYAQHRFTVADEAGGIGTVKWSEHVIYFAAAKKVLADLPSAEPELEELKTVADKFGYSLVKKTEKVKLLPCSCGCKKKPTEWVKASNENSGWFYKCDECNKKSEVVDTKIGAKRAWNRMILEQGE